MGKVSLFIFEHGRVLFSFGKFLQGRCLPVQLIQGHVHGFMENFELSALANTSNYLRIRLLRKIEPKISDVEPTHKS